MADLTVIEGGRDPSSITAVADMMGLEPSTIPLYGLTIMAFSDLDGRKVFGYTIHGTRNNVKLIGLLNLTLYELCREAEGEL